MTLQHSPHDDEHGSRHDYWDAYPDTFIPDEQFTSWADLEAELPAEDWDNLEGVDLDGYASDDEVLTESVAWLHSLLYSDYADPSDDDDRAGMNIPRSVLDRIDGETF